MRPSASSRRPTTRPTSAPTSNKRFVAAMQKDYDVLPGGYSAGMYVTGQCVEAAIQTIGGQTDDRKALTEALHKVSLSDTPRGAGQVRPVRQRDRRGVHPPLREEGRPARQHGDQDLPEREPVLDLRREEFPGQPGLRARLSAGQEPRE